MSETVFSECSQKMTNAVEALKREFAKLRVGKATPALLVTSSIIVFLKLRAPVAGRILVVVSGPVYTPRWVYASPIWDKLRTPAIGVRAPLTRHPLRG